MLKKDSILFMFMIIDAVRSYVNRKGIAFNEVDAYLFLNKTVLTDIWTHPESRMSSVLAKDLDDVFTKNAQAVGHLLEVGEVEVIDPEISEKYTYRLIVDMRSINPDRPTPIYAIERSLYGGSKVVIKDRLPTLSMVSQWFLEYLNKIYPSQE